jgi:hypothetical protein
MKSRRRSQSAPRRKKLSPQAQLGARGVNLIERVVTKMGSRWNPAGSTEVGIDGYIELFEPGSGDATGAHLSVQSKAVTRLERRGDEISFPCRREDIAYWLETTPPLILVVSQPEQDEAYWLSVKHYFGAGPGRGTTVARFDAKRARLTERSYEALAEVARPPERIPMRIPGVGHETLYSNLVPLQSYPARIYAAPSLVRSYSEAWATARELSAGYVPGAWLLHSGSLVSFSDLRDGPLSGLVDVACVEHLDSGEWAMSSDPDRRRLFVRLLNLALRDDLGATGVRYFEDDDVFAFKSTPDEGVRTFEYRNLHKQSRITVVARYTSKAKDGREFPYRRHNAFIPRFRLLGGQWHLEITPTYRFTTDGIAKYRFHEQQLAGIKRYEGNRAVLSQLLMWGYLLSTDTMFDRRRLLAFGPPTQFRIDRAIPEDTWRAANETAEAHLTDLPLFNGGTTEARTA